LVSRNITEACGALGIISRRGGIDLFRKLWWDTAILHAWLSCTGLIDWRCVSWLSVRRWLLCGL